MGDVEAIDAARSPQRYAAAQDRLRGSRGPTIAEERELHGSFYFIAILETVAFGGFGQLGSAGMAAGHADALRMSLAFSMLVFVVLAYGSRLTQKFDIAGWNSLYCSAPS